MVEKRGYVFFPLDYSLKAVVNTVGGLLASRRVFLLVTVRFFLFLVDKLRRKHPFKHANKEKAREDCCIVQVTCKTVAFGFFKHILK